MNFLFKCFVGWRKVKTRRGSKKFFQQKKSEKNKTVAVLSTTKMPYKNQASY